jgi:RNA recognition motif-containing protein
MTRIFVGNLPYDMCESQLRVTFERYGRVASVRIPTDLATRQSRGFGFVNMPSLDDADEAITRLSGTSIKGRELTVNEARDHRNDGPAAADANCARSRALQMFDELLSG